MPTTLSPTASRQTDHAAAPIAPPGADAISSTTLLAGRPYVLIEHGGALYWLRTTRAGKLILTK